MGVRGLQSFLDKEKQTRRIDIRKEIEKWKSRNPGKQPLIVIDFYNIAHPMAMQNPKENICGGRHQKTLNLWKKLLDAFKTTECTMVFLADSNLQEAKIDEWLSRQNSEFNGFKKLYDAIDNGENCPIKLAKKTQRNALSSLHHGMAMQAHEYGRFFYSIRHEADLEIANYANRHRAMAVISDDSDFFIFDGLWRLWSSSGIVQAGTRLKTIEYHRNSIGRILSLTKDQLPLFATLLGNDITNTKTFNLKMDNFFKKIGPPEQRIQSVAKFVQDLGRGRHGMNFKCISERNIQQIVEKIFGHANSTWQQVIRNSIDSYNTNYSPAAITDPIEKKLLHSNMYPIYMECMASVQMIKMTFYDLRGCESDTSLPDLLIDWMKRKKGILMNGAKDPASTFTSLVTKNFNEKYMAYEETLTYPDFSVPNLNKLYSSSNNPESIRISYETRWKIFGWIMSLSSEVIRAIKQLPKPFLLICTTLHALVKHRLISIEAADGILYTENAIHERQATENTIYPKAIEAANIRAVHIYNIGFSAVRENFAIAGLLQITEQIMQFDGVFCQSHMEKMASLNAEQRKSVLKSIEKYRIYAANN